jgi:peptidoglycan-associated lipoprotein
MVYSLALVLLISSLGFGCAKAPRNHWWQFWRPKRSQVVHLDDNVVPGPPGMQPYGTTDAWSGNLDPDMLAINPDEELIGLPEPEPIREPTEGLIANLATIYFDYDSFVLSAEARQALALNAEWVADHPDLTIRVEGHCDERGTEEYNYNLGQKRAQSVREYLVGRGIDESRLHTWSWGELRPLVPGNDEMAWSQNRRVQFAVWSVD